MAVNVSYFDSRTGSVIYHPNRKEEALRRKILGDSLLEYYYGDQAYQTGKLDKYSTAKELRENKPLGTELLLSSKGATYYFQDTEKLTDKIFPDITHRAAYGSILLGGCKNSSVGYDRSLKVLFVDDTTGESGGQLSPEWGRRLTGDCHGKVSIPFANEVFQTSKTITQFRFGTKDNPALGTWIGKGVLGPIDMGYTDIEWLTADRPDVIISLSSLKGKLKGIKDLPKPGLYSIDPGQFWIGQKSIGKLTKTAMSQLVSSYPAALEDILPVVTREAKNLSVKQRDIVSLAELYCSSHEAREISLLENSDEDLEQRTDPQVYTVVRAALDKGNYAWLKIPAIVEELESFVAGEWKDLALGKSKALAWDGAVIMPSKDLRNGELCVPWLADGEKLLYYRSPFINSNGACIGNNKLDIWELSPSSGANVQNIIYISDQTVDDILANHEADLALYNAVIEQFGDRDVLVTSEPSRVAAFDRAVEGIQYFDTLVAPYESIEQFKELYQTDAERMQADYDGDNIAVVPAVRFPKLAEEIERKLLPENLLPSITKLEKVSFPQDLTLEDAVVFMAGGYVQLINASGTSLIATKSEVDLLQQFGSDSDKYNFLMRVRLSGDNFSQAMKQGKQSISLVTCETYDLHTSPEFDRVYAQFLANPFLTDLDSLKSLADESNKKLFVGALAKAIERLVEADKKNEFGLVDGGNFTVAKLPAEFMKMAINLGRRLKDKSLSPNDAFEIYAQLSSEFVQRYGGRETSHSLPVVSSLAQDLNLDAALKEYASAVAVGIGEIGQQNQIAVDIFKSARLPDEGLVEGIKGLLGNRVQILQDKRRESELYKGGKVLEPNNYSPLDVLAGLVNSIYVDNRVGEGTAAESFKEYFEKLQVPEDYRAFAQYYRARYNDLQMKSAQAREIEALEGDLSLVLQDEFVHFEVTNIDRRLYTTAIRDRDCTISILPSKVGIHRYEVFLEVEGKLEKLGVISKKSEAINSEVLGGEPVRRAFGAGNSYLQPVNLNSEILSAETRQLIEEFNEQIDSKGWSRRTMVAALGQVLSGGNSKLNFLVRAMPQDFGFFVRSDGGLNVKFPKSQLLSDSVLDGNIDRQFQVTEDPATNDKALSILGENGIETIAKLDAKTMLVPGVEYSGTLISRAPTLEMEFNTDRGFNSFRVGKLDNYGFDRILSGEKLNFRVQRKHEESYSAYVLIEGKKILLGRLEQPKTVFDLLKGSERSEFIASEVVESGGLSAIKVNIGDDSIILSAGAGGKVKSDWRYQISQDVKVEISLDVNRSLTPTLLIEADLGEGFRSIGEVTRKEDVKLLQRFKESEVLEGTANSKVSMVDFAVLSTAKSYNWDAPPINLTNSNNELIGNIIDKVGFNQSIYAEGQTAWLMPDGKIQRLETTTLAFSAPVIGTAIGWLQAKGVNPLIVPADHPEVAIETQRGYTVLRIPSEDIPQPVREALNKRFGDPISTDIQSGAKLALDVLLDRSSSPYESLLEQKKVVEPFAPTVLKELKPWLEKSVEDFSRVELQPLKPVFAEFKSVAREIAINFQGKLQVSGDYLIVTFPSVGLRDTLVRNLGFVGLQEPVGGKYAAVAAISDLDSYLDSRVVQYFDRDPANPFREIEQGNNPLSIVSGKASSKQHRDLLMAEEASKFIGRSIEPGASYVDSYRKSWGDDANPSRFAVNDIIMVSGDVKITNKATAAKVFAEYYEPLLDKAAEVGAKVLVGNSPGIDRSTQKYLRKIGYELRKENGYYVAEFSGVLPQVDVAQRFTPDKEVSLESRAERISPESDPYSQKPDRNPLEGILGVSQKGFAKDVQMASQANKFIGTFAAQNSIRAAYPGRWGERSNLATYTKADIVMVSGDSIGPSLPNDRQADHFDRHYKPLLSAAVSAGATILVGDRKGIDREVQTYLINRGYKLEFTHGFVSATADSQISQVSTLPKISPPVMFSVDSSDSFVSQFMKACVANYKSSDLGASREERFTQSIAATVSTPAIRSRIEKFGGVEWLKTCSFESKSSPQMAGKSLESGFIQIAVEAYSGRNVTAEVVLPQSQTITANLAKGNMMTVVTEVSPTNPTKGGSLRPVSVFDLVPKTQSVDSSKIAARVISQMQQLQQTNYNQGDFVFNLANADDGVPRLQILREDKVVFLAKALGQNNNGEIVWEGEVCEITENFFDDAGEGTTVVRRTKLDSSKKVLAL